MEPLLVLDSGWIAAVPMTDTLLFLLSVALGPVLGLCHLRCDARFAGQLKTLSHSGHRYSTWTIREHLCCAKPNASAYLSLQRAQI